MKGEAEDTSFVVEGLILSDDKGLIFVLQHLMNRSIICLKTQQEGERRMTTYSNLS